MEGGSNGEGMSSGLLLANMSGTEEEWLDPGEKPSTPDPTPSGKLNWPSGSLDTTGAV